MRSIVFLAAGAAAALISGAAQAGTVLVFDYFESYGGPTANFTGFDDLNVIGAVDLLQDTGMVTTPYGTGLVDLDGTAAGPGRIETDAFAFQAGDIVTFEFDYAGNRQGGAPDSLIFGFKSAGLFTFQEIVIQNGAVKNTANNVIASTFGTSVGNLSPLAPWTHLSFSFNAGGAGSLAAYVTTTSNDAKGPLIDNLRLTKGPISAAPEPASWALMILGFGGAGAMLRRREVKHS